jgi:DNA segregation ATPase FtsK/SpoIIIE, S-DNA-T family
MGDRRIMNTKDRDFKHLGGQELGLLLGHIAYNYLCEVIREGVDDASPDGYIILSNYSPGVVAGLAAAASADEGRPGFLRLMLNENDMAGQNVDSAHLCPENAVAVRNMPTDGKLLVAAEFERDKQSLAAACSLDSQEMEEPGRASVWVKSILSFFGVRFISDEQFPEAEALTKGLLHTYSASSESAARYLSYVFQYAISEGTTISAAAGVGLPQLGLPLFAECFDKIAATQPSKWRDRLHRHWRNEAYLSKRDTSRNLLDVEELRRRLREFRAKNESGEGTVSDHLLNAFDSYIESETGRTPEAEALLYGFDWSQVHELLEKSSTSRAQALGKATLAHFDVINEEIEAFEKALLESIDKRKPKQGEPGDDLREFFEKHADMISEDPRLLKRWEEVIHGKDIVCTDLFDGLIRCIRKMSALANSSVGQQLGLRVIGRKQSRPLSFLSKNRRACEFFEHQYRSLTSFLSGSVTFHDTMVFDYSDEVLPKITDRKDFRGNSSSKIARQFEFEVRLVEKETSSEAEVATCKLIWQFEHRSVLARMRDDLRRLAKNVSRTSLVLCVAERESVGPKGTVHPLTLEDVSGFHEGASGRGSFVPAKSKCRSLALEWRTILKNAVERTEVSESQTAQYESIFERFEQSYNACIAEMAVDQLSVGLAEDMVSAYGSLLEELSTIPDESSRRRMLKPLMLVGMAAIPESLGEGAAVVVCPWHPLRIQAMGARNIQLREAILSQLRPGRAQFSDRTGDLYQADVQQLIDYPMRPEMAVGWVGDMQSSPREMCVSQSFGGYSLHEYPFADDGDSSAIHDAPEEGARIVKRLVGEYLRLQPHERSNLSIALYNSDSATLPLTVVNEINKLNGEDNDITCQVILTHSNGDRLREIYKRLVGRSVDPDELLGTEATGDFLSRVRINILATSQIEQPGRCASVDIALCQDIVSREAAPDWWRVPRISFAAEDLQPHQWSRRQPVAANDDVCRLYLACPCQTSEGWQYLLAVGSVFSNEAQRAWEDGECRILTRKIDFSQHNLGAVFRDTHRIATWVVNHDELLDRRLLEAQGVSVIRYEQSTTHGRNLVVSTKAPDPFLRSSLLERLQDILGDELDDSELSMLSDRLLSDASSLSGGLVLKAARRSRNTNELIGCVLSQFLLRSQLGELGDRCAWSLLDDYAKWLGKTPGSGIADILCLVPVDSLSTGKHLEILISEAKFIQYQALSEAKRKSARQLRDTLVQIEAALTSQEIPPDQDIWLARISDLLSMNLHSHRSPVLEDWKAAIRRGQCSVRVRGYSHVLCYGPKNELGPKSESTGVRDCARGYQEVLAHEDVKKCLLAYIKSESKQVNELRSAIGQIDLSALPEESERVWPRRIRDTQGESEEVSPPAPSEAKPSVKPEVCRKPEEAPEPDAPERNDTEGNKNDMPDSGLVSLRDFLRNASESLCIQSESSNDWLEEIAGSLRAAFIRRELPCKIVSSILTPNAAVLKLQGSQNLTVAKIEATSEEIKTSEAIDIIAVRPEMGQISVSVRRPQREILHSVSMFDQYLSDLENGLEKSSIPVAVNEDDGSIIYLKPFDVPHSLIAGETGSGKSVLMCNLIAAISLAQSPSLSEIILIDPKQGNDYQAVLDLPHLRRLDGQPLVTEPDHVLSVLDDAVAEMVARNKMFLEARSNNLQTYREKTGKTLPVLWIIYDEFGVWMQDSEFKKAIMPKINKLAKQSRSAGIFLVLADQRPDNTVFPLQTRDNLGNRFVLSVNSVGTSEISLGDKGAEKLLKHGHILAKTADFPYPQYAQVPYISPEGMSDIVSLIRSEHKGDYRE